MDGLYILGEGWGAQTDYFSAGRGNRGMVADRYWIPSMYIFGEEILSD